ncbi:MAG: ABC transporter permease [Paracoccus sp. (in: a-proteobacteria)]|nr:ABC transporter permease [Paracoccus sp. (in: a-proteobacteria)]
MTRYIGKRIALSIPTLLGVATIVFFMLHLLPGDAALTMLRAEGGSPTPEMIAQLREQMGLSRPLLVQYGDFMRGLVTLDLGTSYWTGNPVTQEIGARLGVTLQVAILAALIGVLIAIPLGAIAGYFAGTWIDYAIRIFAIGGIALPSFWFGMIVALLLLWSFNWLPPLGQISPFQNPGRWLQQMALPAIAVGYRYAAILIRMMRASVIETLHEDYVRTARAKGLRRGLIARRHVVPNSLLPTITMIGLEFALLIGSLVVIEQVFSLNGVGRLFIESISRGDLIVIQGIVICLTVIFITANLLVDFAYAAIDPRIEY